MCLLLLLLFLLLCLITNFGSTVLFVKCYRNKDELSSFHGDGLLYKLHYHCTHTSLAHTKLGPQEGGHALKPYWLTEKWGFRRRGRGYSCYSHFKHTAFIFSVRYDSTWQAWNELLLGCRWRKLWILPVCFFGTVAESGFLAQRHLLPRSIEKWDKSKEVKAKLPGHRTTLLFFDTSEGLRLEKWPRCRFAFFFCVCRFILQPVQTTDPLLVSTDTLFTVTLCQTYF